MTASKHQLLSCQKSYTVAIAVGCDSGGNVILLQVPAMNLLVVNANSLSVPCSILIHAEIYGAVMGRPSLNLCNGR